MTGSPGSAGSLVIRQPERGYRFSIDPVLLAGFAASHCSGGVLDLGTGCGVLLLLLSRLVPAMRFGVGVEIQESLCAFAEGNFRENGLDRRFRAVNADFRGEVRGVPAAAFGLVVANPPFGPVGRGRTNPNPEKEAARHEIFCTLPELFAAAGRRLAPAGHFALVYPHDRLPDILSCARREGMRSVTLRRVHARKGAMPSRVLVLMSRGEGDVPTDMPPLFLHEGDGKYCPEVESICRLFRSGSQPAPG